MAEIIKPNGINTKEDAIAAAERVIENQRTSNESKRFELQKFLDTLANISPESGGFDEIGAMLALPEEHFAIIAPAFLSSLERGLNNINDKMLLVQSMNLMGMKTEQVREQYETIYNELDAQLGSVLSHQKRDFLKRMLAMTYNALTEADGVAKKNILIPIEYCHTDVKMPAYAHLTDSGMDIFAIDDITIAPGETKLVPTGLKVALPAGYELQVRPKSGRCLRTKLRVANTPGTIDAGYRDEIGVIIDNIEPFIKSADMDENGRLYNVEFGSSYTIGKGEKFAQLVLCEVPKAVFYQVESVGEIENDGRAGGFGSTGVK